MTSESRGSEAATADRPATSDDVLVRRAALGDRSAFAALVRRHAPAMFRYAVSMLDGDVHDAEDATQNALAKAWEHLPGFRNDAAIRTWLFRITANEVRALRRSRRSVPTEDWLLHDLPAPAEVQPEDTLDADELRSALLSALSELPWRQRACWVLAEQEGLSYQEIAEALETTVGVVRGQLHRARATLAARMAHWR